MLRRSTSTSQLQLSLLTASATRPCVPLVLCSPSRTFFDNLKKQFGAMSNNNTNNSNNSSGPSSGSTSEASGAPQTPPGFPPGFNAQQMQTLQQLFNSQPKDKQDQLIKQAMEMQKMMGKMPGLGKFAQKNAAMMEQMLKMQSATMQPPPTTTTTTTPSSQTTSSTGTPRRDLFKDAAAGSSTSSNAHRGGPSLDELKKVNLGPEIEALFEELRTIRNRKNEYRDKYSTAQAALENLQKEHRDLAAREANLRSKLAKAEQEVMLLTSENIELREGNKTLKQLTAANKQLKQEVEQLRSAAQASAAPGTASYAALKQQQQSTEDALRSLQRKVDRMRRRDPLLQFSLACSDVSRLCGAVRAEDSGSSSNASGSQNAISSNSAATSTNSNISSGAAVAAAASEAGLEASEQAFAALQSAYYERQQQAWAEAAQDRGAAAAAYIAVVRRFTVTRVPHANYDAVVSFTGDVSALRAVLTSAGFTVENVAGEPQKVAVVAAADAEVRLDQPGPYGYALALRLAAGQTNTSTSAAGNGGSSEPSASSFTVTNVHPFVSLTLINNAKRSVVQYETARASGPGGQATNVTETQVYAKLSIDGVAAYTAEAQDSRSALSNKEAALEKLRQQRRQQYNDTLVKQCKAEAVQAQLAEVMRGQGGFTVEDEVVRLVQEAAANKQVTVADAALVDMMQVLSRTAAATA